MSNNFRLLLAVVCLLGALLAGYQFVWSPQRPLIFVLSAVLIGLYIYFISTWFRKIL